MYRRSPALMAQIIAVSVAFMVLLLASEATAQRVVDEATLVDANGKQIGTLHVSSRDDDPFVLIELDDHSIVHVAASPGGFAVASNTYIYWASADCSGQAYAYVRQGLLVPPAPVGPPGATLYQSGSSTSTVQVYSTVAPGGTGGCQSCAMALSCPTGPAPLVPLTPVVDLNTLFTPPFHVVAASSGTAACCGDCNHDGSVTVNEIITSVNYALDGCPAVASAQLRR